MDRQATELNQLSRLLFDKAAAFWQYSIAASFLASLVGIFASMAALGLKENATLAAVAAVILAISYYLRFSFEEIHGAAETMRRQSVLSEGLGWAIPRGQFNEWRQRAGSKILKAIAANPRPDDYYETKSAKSAKRLAEMTFESVFWTKSLYRKMSSYLVTAMLAAVIISVGVLFVLPLLDLATTKRLFVVYFIYLAIPLFVSVDMLGLFLRLQRAISALTALSPNIETLANEQNPNSDQVLRLVAEYNCALAAGLPIPKWVFARHHNEIVCAELTDARANGVGDSGRSCRGLLRILVAASLRGCECS